MGSVYKKQTTRPVPAGAVILTEGGGRVARWRVRGKLRKTPLTTGEDGSDRIVTESATYYAKYRDAAGVVVVKPTGCRDKQAAEQLLKKWEREVEQIKAGTLDRKGLDAARQAAARSKITCPPTSVPWSRPRCPTCTGRTSCGRSGRCPPTAGSPPRPTSPGRRSSTG